MKPKVSIVVPIYNVEKYLPQCVDSLLAQSLREIELILVDDGSPDGCGSIADGYARQDDRVKVIHQKNAGLGPARNAGIGAASGEYIGFVDSDDWVKPQMYERLYEAVVGARADIGVSGHRDVADGRVLRSKSHPLAGTTLSADEIRQMRKNLYGHAPCDKITEAFPMSVCMSLYRREMLVENRLEFPNILSEDTLFNLDAYRCAKVIAFTGGTDYCYRKEGQASITQSFSEGKLRQYQEFLTVLSAMAAEEGDPDCILRAKRAAIDYCRLYVGLAENADLPLGEKLHCIRTFSQAQAIRSCWEGYPLETLPIQQRLFHSLILSEHYGAALALSRLRRWTKKEFYGSKTQ